MGVLSKAELFNAAKARPLPTRDVPCPEWGDGAIVRVRMLTAAERDRMEAVIAGDGKGQRENVRAKVVASCFVGPNGDEAFTTEDVQALGATHGDVIDRLFDAATDLNKMRRKEAGDGEPIKGA